MLFKPRSHANGGSWSVASDGCTAVTYNDSGASRYNPGV